MFYLPDYYFVLETNFRFRNFSFVSQEFRIVSVYPFISQEDLFVSYRLFNILSTNILFFHIFCAFSIFFTHQFFHIIFSLALAFFLFLCFNKIESYIFVSF